MAGPGTPGSPGGRVPAYLDSLKNLMRAIAEAKLSTGADQQLLAQIEAMVLQSAQQQAAAAMQPQMGQPGAQGLQQLMGGLMGGMPGAMAGGAPGGLPGGGLGGGGQVGGLTPAPGELDRMMAGTQ